jgi:hypothetical protein
VRLRLAQLGGEHACRRSELVLRERGSDRAFVDEEHASMDAGNGDADVDHADVAGAPVDLAGARDRNVRSSNLTGSPRIVWVLPFLTTEGR